MRYRKLFVNLRFMVTEKWSLSKCLSNHCLSDHSVPGVPFLVYYSYMIFSLPNKNKGKLLRERIFVVVEILIGGGGAKIW